MSLREKLGMGKESSQNRETAEQTLFEADKPDPITVAQEAFASSMGENFNPTFLTSSFGVLRAVLLNHGDSSSVYGELAGYAEQAASYAKDHDAETAGYFSGVSATYQDTQERITAFRNKAQEPVQQTPTANIPRVDTPKGRASK